MNLVGFEETTEIKKTDKLNVVDPNTGEIRNYIGKGDKIVRKSSIDSFKNLKDKESEGVCEEWRMKDFYKANTEEVQLISKELSQYEKSFLFSISAYVSYDNNSLQIKKGDKLKDIGTEDLIEITGMSRSKIYEIVDSLHKQDIIYRGKNSKNAQYYINPWLYCKGNRINKVLKNMFKNYKIRTHENITWEDYDNRIR